MGSTGHENPLGIEQDRINAKLSKYSYFRVQLHHISTGLCSADISYEKPVIVYSEDTGRPEKALDRRHMQNSLISYGTDYTFILHSVLESIDSYTEEIRNDALALCGDENRREISMVRMREEREELESELGREM